MITSSIQRLIEASVLDPLIVSPVASPSLKAGARFARMCLRRLPDAGKMRYLRSAIRGTGRSHRFAATMRAAGFLTFEDILKAAEALHMAEAAGAGV
jgi:hypothetical protein